MRTKSSIKNMILSVLMNGITIIVGFIAQAIFLKILGTEYLGINGLFNNIVSILGIAELGIGSAIIYHLYKPIAKDDKETIKSLMQFYRKAYHLIALVIFALGLILIPFLPFFIKNITVEVNVILVHILFIVDIICSYLLSYKRSILYADQKNYIINIVHIFYTVFLNLFQLIILYFTKNYYLYLIIKIVMRVIENIVITLIVNKKYTYLKEKRVKKLDKEISNDIFKKVKALFNHKIGTFVINGTDNIIISRFLGIISVGLYSNYYMIINAVQTLFSQMLISLTPSIGNLLVEDNQEKNFEIFKKIRFINFIIATFCSISILIIMDNFITVWIGKEYILPQIVLGVLVINFYQKMMRNSYITFKEAAGIFYEDRFIPIIESVINIIASIILVKIFGLAGVFMGTIISGLILWCYSYPKYVYKKIFNRNYLDYIKGTIAYMLLFVAMIVSAYYLVNILVFNNIVINILYRLIFSFIFTLIIIIIIFGRTDNWKYLINIIFKRKGEKNA